MERYQIAIIGTGPAGLEAAITAKIRNKKILLIGDKNLSAKVEKAHTVENYLGLPHISGTDLRDAFRRHLEQMEIEITEDRVNAVYAMGDYFSLQGHADLYEAESVILACGLSAAKPLPGELENLGRGVSYCATCDGGFFRGKEVIVVAFAKEDAKEANFLAELTDHVTYIAMYEGEEALDQKIRKIEGQKLVSIAKEDGKMRLQTETEAFSADGLFILRENIPPSQLVPGLQIEKNQVVVDRAQRTNIEGLFACGDITGAPYQFIKAAGEGNVAALSAVGYLAR